MIAPNPDCFSSASRLLVFAPHPDDESLGCGVALQRAVAARADVRVIYATDGENNPWPQRVIYRKWRVSAADRLRWGIMRRAEALAALRVLGINDQQAQFLGLPDQELTSLFKRDRKLLLEQVAKLVDDFKPTHLFVTSPADTHPDHSALGILLRLVLQKYFADGDIDAWSYVVHGRNSSFRNSAMAISQSNNDVARKRLAIGCHKSQIKLSRRRFFAYADRPEQFLRFSSSSAPLAQPVIAHSSPGEQMLLLQG